MKAIIYTQYGSPEVLHLAELTKPEPQAGEVLVKIHAAAMNRTDCGFRKPDYFLVRLVQGMFKPKKQVLGTEFSGVVESIGGDVGLFAVGDEVFGLSTANFGTHAQYICLPETGSFALKPQYMTFIEAGAVCDGLMLANAFLKEIKYHYKPKVLINGASGSIGTAAVQLAKYFGAEVTAVSKTTTIDLVKSLGADHVIDYLKEDFTKIPAQYDLVFDAVGKSSFFKCKKILKPKGLYLSTEFGYLSQNIFLTLLTPIFGGKKVKFPIAKDSKEVVLFFKKLIEEGKYKAVIDRVYPMEKAVEAAKYVETGEKTGNVVLQILPFNS